MTISLRALVISMLVLVATSSWGEQRPETPGVPGDMPAHVKAAYTFLMAWGKGNWEEAKAVAAEAVSVKVGDQEFTLDVAGGQAAVALVFPFKGISTVRVEGKVKGVTVEEIGVKVGETERRARGTLTLDETDGQFRVTGVAVE